MSMYVLVLCFQLVFLILSIGLCLRVERYNTGISSSAVVMKDWIKKNYKWSLFKTIEQDILGENNIVPSGLVVGLRFVAWVNISQVNYGYSSETVYDIWFCYRFERPNVEQSNKKSSEEMIVFKKVRPYLAATYEECRLPCIIIDKPEFKPIEKVAKEIVELGNHSKKKIGIFNCIILITGPSGRGKSHITKYISKLLNYNPYFVEDFDPTSPAQTTEMILKEITPTSDKPLVVMISEVDKVIERFHSGKVQPHQNFCTQVRDKDSWNSFLDSISFVDNTITIMTTNKPYDFFINLDASYLRKGRVHKIYNFGGDKSYFHKDVTNISLSDIANSVLRERLNVV